MAEQGDLQELLKMLTSRKVPILKAMEHVQALQAQKLRSIDEMAQAPVSTIETALKDSKLAKTFHAACRNHGKNTLKRSNDDAASPSTKRPKLVPHKRDVDYNSMTADELEESMQLPVVEDENVIQGTTVVTNRAPLVLAFAVELLRITMPEQPPSSRLSLAQAIVSANSRTKAVSLGIEKQSAAGHHIPEGQPKVRVLDREIAVLKRGGYSWKPSEADIKADIKAGTHETRLQSTVSAPHKQNAWTASQTLSSRASTFVAHAICVDSPSQRWSLIKALMEQKPELETATHNAWAIRTSYGNSPLVQEASFDDGETGCGKFMLEMLREAKVSNTVVLLTRWFGGVMLGPDRWRLMRQCVNDALSSQMRTLATATSLAGDAVWALDAHGETSSSAALGMAIHRPEGARNYLLRSFASPKAGHERSSSRKKSGATEDEQRQENLARLLGALRILFASWAEVLSKEELDRRAWSWYVAVRPEVEAGPGGWGAKGPLSLSKVLELRRKAPSQGGVEEVKDSEV
ncbi:hypothetical protein CDD81_7055 [Ophiocordyceps australis]|uniref:Impact N-terminal domain-containing protein n=1 Tax=Ophiocordyceps australis TaxID=1399860 RepID=A0A2C5YGG7_9HYPO|nr:hypothetical protein CDD81_7055 [Ophiocordyceps australis]